MRQRESHLVGRSAGVLWGNAMAPPSGSALQDENIGPEPCTSEVANSTQMRCQCSGIHTPRQQKHRKPSLTWGSSGLPQPRLTDVCMITSDTKQKSHVPIITSKSAHALRCISPSSYLHASSNNNVCMHVGSRCNGHCWIVVCHTCGPGLSQLPVSPTKMSRMTCLTMLQLAATSACCP